MYEVEQLTWPSGPKKPGIQRQKDNSINKQTQYLYEQEICGCKLFPLPIAILFSDINSLIYWQELRSLETEH